MDGAVTKSWCRRVLPPLLLLMPIAMLAGSDAAAAPPVAGMMAPREPAPEKPGPIAEAARAGDVAKVQALYAASTPGQRTMALHAAVQAKQVPVLEALLNAGLDKSRSDLDSALRHAAYLRSKETIALLCARGADPNSFDEQGKAALHQLYSSMQPGFETAQQLMACGANPMLPQHDRYCTDGKCASYARPLLHTAVVAGDVPMINYLLDHGAPVNGRDEFFDDTAIFKTRGQGTEIVRLLLQRGADPNVRAKGYSLIGRAVCMKRSPEMVEVLLKAGARLGPEPLPPLGCAAGDGDLKSLELLLAAGADPNEKSRDGHTALEEAIERGAPPGKLTPEEQEALRVRMVRLLLEHGAQPALAGVETRAWGNDPIGQLLGPPLEKYYTAQVRECIVNLPTTAILRAKPSPRPAAPAHGRFTPALITPLTGLGAIPYAFVLSPDGRWLAFLQERPAGGLFFYDFTKDMLRGPLPSTPTDMGWSENSRYFLIGKMAVEVTSGVPRSVPLPDPLPYRSTDERGCGGRNSAGHLSGRNYFSSLPEEQLWAPESPIRYQLLKQPGEPDRVVAMEGTVPHELIAHDKAWVKEAWQATGLPPRFPVPPEDLDLYFRGSLSPNGNYLYYELRAGGLGWGHPPAVSRRFVINVKSRPVQVWEIEPEVWDIRWHPNGHDLLLRQKTERSPYPSPLAVASFPE